MYSQISGGRSGGRDGTIPKDRVRIFPALSSPSALQVGARDGVSEIVHRRARDCGTELLVCCGRVCVRPERKEEWEVKGETRKIRSPDAPAFVAPRVATDRSNESRQPWMLRVTVYVVGGTVSSVRVHVLHVYPHGAFLVWTQRQSSEITFTPEDLVPGPSIRSPAIASEPLSSSGSLPDSWLSIRNFERVYQLPIYHDSSRLHR